ncbi:MAG: hypothetical protein DRN05_02810 [Thermoplasmata archaeon]|nr:MAG: hypothetical protein DRN05_02810 [Thermoplasmata archaeon]
MIKADANIFRHHPGHHHISPAMVVGSILILASLSMVVIPSAHVRAGSYDGEDLAYAILADPSTLISSYYTDTDTIGHRQAGVFTSLGTMHPTNGSTFVILSTGIAGAVPVTTNSYNPGSERGTYFHGRYGYPRDRASLTLVLQVPQHMHYLYYDVQFLSAEYPEYVGTQYNDKLTVTVDSPSQGTSTYIIDVNSGNFVLTAHNIPGTGFDIFATSGNPNGVDWVSTTPRDPGADAGATALVTAEHPVSPNEIITVTFTIKDTGDNQFDSAAFIDNLMFSGYAKTEITSRKTVQDLNGEPAESNDILEYTITISNTGNADQNDNPGNEFEDIIPENTTYVAGSATATSGTIQYNSQENKIEWNGEIPKESSIALTFRVTINTGLRNNTIISNQGIVYWDSDEDGINDKTELTDDPNIDDGVDQDGDGETGDDDPTNITVFAYEPPSTLTEDFSDDTPGGNATQSYQGHQWFETTQKKNKINFEVAPSYHYQTPQSFKIKIRKQNSPQYWNYSFSQLNSQLQWWEAWFACGNTSEEYSLQLNFKNSNNQDIARIKFEYTNNGTDPVQSYVLKLSYWDPDTENWTQLQSNHINGYLFNGWYKIRLQINNSNYIDYSLNQSNQGVVDIKTGRQIHSSLSDLTRIEWTTTYNPIICPIFFWDEHKIGLTQLT